MTLSDRATTFGAVAEEYARWRPSYPAPAVDWLVPPEPACVADVGAGTGKLTELLLARGLEVDAVEPDKRMLAVLGRSNPSARRHRSSSTRIPVEDGALDAVLVADAWHWFDPEPTIREVRRVLKAGGWLGLVWNVAAEPIESWERALADDSDEYDRKSKASPEGLNTRLSCFDKMSLSSSNWSGDGRSLPTTLPPSWQRPPWPLPSRQRIGQRPTQNPAQSLSKSAMRRAGKRFASGTSPVASDGRPSTDTQHRKSSGVRICCAPGTAGASYRRDLGV